LAAGRTAGFPRLTQEQIDIEVPHAPASAAAVLSDAADPNETCVLPAFDKDFGIPKVDIPTPVSLRDDAQPKKPKRKVHPDEDAYHKHKRHIPKPVIVIAVLAAVCPSPGVKLFGAGVFLMMISDYILSVHKFKHGANWILRCNSASYFVGTLLAALSLSLPI